jgi:hypothetical protein
VTERWAPWPRLAEPAAPAREATASWAGGYDQTRREPWTREHEARAAWVGAGHARERVHRVLRWPPGSPPSEPAATRRGARGVLRSRPGSPPWEPAAHAKASMAPGDGRQSLPCWLLMGQVLGCRARDGCGRQIHRRRHGELRATARTCITPTGGETLARFHAYGGMRESTRWCSAPPSKGSRRPTKRPRDPKQASTPAPRTRNDRITDPQRHHKHGSTRPQAIINASTPDT